MPQRQFLATPPVPPELLTGIERLQQGLGVPGEFPEPVLTEASRLVASPPEFPQHQDRSDIEFLAIDPKGTTDVDQILAIEKLPTGFIVRYAIADLAAWITPGGAIDTEAHARGQTYYSPAGRAPLHPPLLSEGAASLLADGRKRPAMLWELQLDAAGNLVDTALTRALVVNSRQHDYAEVDQLLSTGRAEEPLQLLREVGLLRQAIEAERGGVSLNLPEQEVQIEEGGWRLDFRELTLVENWNAQISLLTGIAAAETMLAGRVGIVRTLQPVNREDLQRLRRIAKTLRVEWLKDQSYPKFVRSLDPDKPNHLAMMTACLTLFRGAGYQSFDGEVPGEEVKHSALVTPYAHVTAPLRRLVDRFGLEICHALLNGVDVPQWARVGLPALPEEMRVSEQRAKKYERALVDLTEALTLRHQIGRKFEGTVVQLTGDRGIVQLAEPAVAARVHGLRKDQLGKSIVVTLVKADIESGQVEFKA